MPALREALIICLPAIVKSHADASGRRMIECEASNQEVDLEGDVLDQAALLGSAKNFLSHGHIDLDHLSEIGHRLGIANPESYILGKPTEVNDLGDGRTGVVGELKRSADGTFNPILNRYDAVWSALNDPPGIPYRASIYGFPVSDAVEDCRGKACSSGATRFHIHAMEWKSLALTQRPVNSSIKGCVKIVTAKAFLADLSQRYQKSPSGAPTPLMLQGRTGVGDSEAGSPDFSPPFTESPSTAPSFPSPDPLWPKVESLPDAVGQYHTHMRRDCPHTGKINSALGFKSHFQNCCGMDDTSSTVYAHALMHYLLQDRRRV